MNIGLFSNLVDLFTFVLQSENISKTTQQLNFCRTQLHFLNITPQFIQINLF